jgi:hypothetical protein
MTFVSVFKSWARVSAMPLFRALVVDGAIFYFVLALTFGLDIVAYMNDEVGGFRPIVFTAALLMRCSFIIP